MEFQFWWHNGHFVIVIFSSMKRLRPRDTQTENVAPVPTTQKEKERQKEMYIVYCATRRSKMTMSVWVCSQVKGCQSNLICVILFSWRLSSIRVSNNDSDTMDQTNKGTTEYWPQVYRFRFDSRMEWNEWYADSDHCANAVIESFWHIFRSTVGMWRIISFGHCNYSILQHSLAIQCVSVMVMITVRFT